MKFICVQSGERQNFQVFKVNNGFTLSCYIISHQHATSNLYRYASVACGLLDSPLNFIQDFTLLKMSLLIALSCDMTYGWETKCFCAIHPPKKKVKKKGSGYEMYKYRMPIY